MQTLIYTLRVQTTKANADALLEYFDRHSGARALLTETDWNEIIEDYQAKVDEWVERTNGVSHAITEALEELKPDLSEVELPEPAEGDEDDDPLFDSTRDYIEQLDRYKKHQDR